MTIGGITSMGAGNKNLVIAVSITAYSESKIGKGRNITYSEKLIVITFTCTAQRQIDTGSSVLHAQPQIDTGSSIYRIMHCTQN